MQELQFVDSISNTATIRLDLDNNPWSVHKDTRFERPRLRRAVAGDTLIEDGETYPASKYTNRVLNLVLQVSVPNQNELGTQLQRLHRELNRPTNILRYRLHTSEPIFFRTFRADVAEDDWPTDGTFAELRVSIPAEPFAYGLKETISPSTVTDDPAAGSNGMFFDLTGIKGDADTPLEIRWARDTGNGPRSVLFATRRRGTVANAPFVLQAEAATMGTDTTVQTTDANYSGATNNYTRTTFATPAMTTRLIFPTVGVAGPDQRGQYKVFIRYTMTGATGSVTARWMIPVLKSGADTSSYFGRVTNLRSGTRVHLQLLDELSFPTGPDVPAGLAFDGTSLPVAQFPLRIQAARVSGSANLDLDYALLVAADDQCAICEVNTHDGTPAGEWVFDGPNGELYGVDGSGRIDVAQANGLMGGPIYASPGVTNRVWFLKQVAYDQTTSKSATTAFTVNYWPQYLGPLRPVAA